MAAAPPPYKEPPLPPIRGNVFFGDFDMAKNGLWLTSDIRDAIKSSTSDADKIDVLEKSINGRMGVLMSLFASLYNTTMQYGAAEKPRDTPAFEMLRHVYEQSLLDRLIVGTRMRQLRHVSQKIINKGKQKGWYVTHINYKESGFKMTPDIKRRCKEVEDMLQTPNPEAHPTGFRDALMKMVLGELLLDRRCIVVTERRRDGKPLSWHMLPPDTILPRFKVLLRKMQEYGISAGTGPSAYESGITQTIDRIGTEFGVDLSDKSYVQMIDGRITGAWRGDEMYVDILNPSDEINRAGFGISPLENSLEATTLLMVAFNFNKNHFLSNYPDAFLILKGEFSPQGLQAFKNQIYAEVGPQGNTRLPVIPTGGAAYDAELLKLRDSMTDMQFAQLVRMAICLKCAAYGMHPATLNFAPDQGASSISTIIASTDGQEAAIAMAQEEGFHCYPWHTVVQTNRGPVEIGRIVKHQAKLKVKSYDLEANRVIWTPITNWGKRDNPEGLWKIEWGRGGRFAQSISTPEHPILTKRGWVKAAELIVDSDKVAVASPELTEEQEQVVLGTLLGDAHIDRKGSKKSGWPSLRLVHCEAQSDYTHWFDRSLNNLDGIVEPRFNPKSKIKGRTIPATTQVAYRSPATPALWNCYQLAYPCKTKYVNQAWLDKIGPIGLAIWAMDDGSMSVTITRKRWTYRNFVFCTQGFSRKERKLISNWLSKRWQLKNRIGWAGQIILSTEATIRFKELVAPYMICGDHEKTWIAKDIKSGPSCGVIYLSVISSAPSPTQGAVYDIAVPRTRCFLVNNLVVHNSHLDGIAQFTGRALITPWYDDLVQVWSVEDQPNEVQRIDLWTKKLAAGAMVDEYRHDEGLEPLEVMTDGKVSGKYVNSPFFFQQQQVAMMEAQQEQQAQAGADREDDSGFTGAEEDEEEPPGPNGGAPKKKLVLARTNGNGNSNGAKPKPKAKIEKSGFEDKKVHILHTRRRWRDGPLCQTPDPVMYGLAITKQEFQRKGWQDHGRYKLCKDCEQKVNQE